MEYQTRIKKISPYEKRKFNVEFLLMQQNLAKVRQAKIPRRVFSFASRKFIQKKVQKEEVVQKEIEYVDANLIKNAKNQTINLEQLAESADLNLQCLENVTLIIPKLRAVYASDLQNCVIKTQAISGALHVELAVNCQFIATCHQLRIHNSVNCTFELDVNSAPIIEKSTKILFKKKQGDS